MPYRQNPKTLSDLNAVILVDFANVHRVTSDLIGNSEQSDGIVIRLLEETQHYVSRQLGYRVVRHVSFDTVASDAVNGHRATAPLLSMGAEQKLVHGAREAHGASIELTLYASELIHQSHDIDTFVLVTGDHWFVPLAHFLKRNGKNVIVASLDTPVNAEQVPSDLSEIFFNTRKLLEKSGRLETNGLPLYNDEVDEYGDSVEEGDRGPAEVSRIEDPIARSGLEIIETYFGQYREVYLTPLLRKFTELLEDEDEPKTVITYLEECGAVWLEKRRGFPHNYTVLIVNTDHPDVIEIKEAFSEDDGDLYYDDDSYGEPSEEYVANESSYGEMQD